MAGNTRRTRIGECGARFRPADESSSARLSRALRGTAAEGAVPPQMGPHHRSSPGRPSMLARLRVARYCARPSGPFFSIQAAIWARSPTNS